MSSQTVISQKLHQGSIAGGQREYFGKARTAVGKGEYMVRICFQLQELRAKDAIYLQSWHLETKFYLRQWQVKELNVLKPFVFLPAAAFHRRIHRRHPAQVRGEQGHHGEPAEPRGFREGRLQTCRRAVADHVTGVPSCLEDATPSHLKLYEKHHVFFCFF